jgi:hypothetical protein
VLTRFTPWLCTALVLITAASGACGSSGSRGRATPDAPILAKPSDLTAAERQWGVGPRRGPNVTYQPDVVLIDEGPDAVVGLAPNGVEWIIDGDSSQAKDLQPGKILFATSRVVGRVLHTRKQGNDVAVVIGPVELTEVVSDLEIKFQAPIDFGEAITYPAFPPGLPGAPTPQAASSDPLGAYGGELRLVSLRAPAIPRQRAFPLVSPHGLGIRINVEGDGSHFDGDAMFALATPELEVDLKIVGTTITRAVLQLKGAAGLTFGFTASTDRGLKGNFDIVEPSLPTDLTIPIVGHGLPLTVSLRQGFSVETAWGGQGSLTAKADFTASGTYDIGWSNGTFGPHGPTNFKWTVHPLATFGHTSAADTGLVMAYQMKVIAGIGGYGFATGPYLRLHTGIGYSGESKLVQLRGCRNASITVSLSAGLGYFLPQALVDGINAILRTFNLKHIRSEGGVEAKSVKLLESHTRVPPIEACSTNGA